MDKLFRGLLIISVVLYSSYYVMPYFYHHWLSEEQLAYISYSGQFSIIQIPIFVSHAIFIGWLLSSIGMFFYNNFARNLFIFLAIVTLVIIPFTGYTSMTALETALFGFLNILDGALIVIALFTSVSIKFQKPPNKQLNQDAT